MDFRLEKSSFPKAATVLVVTAPYRIDRHSFYKSLAETDRAYLKSAVAVFDAKAPSTRTFILPSGKVIMTLPAGERKTFTRRKVILAIRRAVASAKAEGLTDIEIYLKDFTTPGLLAGAELAELIATQAELAHFEFVAYKTAPPEGWKAVKTLRLISEPFRAPLTNSLQHGKLIGEEINKARELSNTPGGDMTPQRLADAAVATGKETGFKVKVFDKTEIEKLGMGGVLGVAKGSNEPPRFIIIEYLKGRKAEKPIALVGKGVTFDTGGLNLKPEQGIYEMHMDMSGGAAVIHTIAALARLGVKKNVVGIIPAVENMPSGSSYHPGDLLKTMSGKTIEVLNTDAEGRVILADALTYAVRMYKPRLVIDIATLTGAAASALGQRASALFTNDPALEKPLRDTGERTGDFVWPLPLWEEFEADIKGTFGDWANLGKTRYGGAITGAVFLWQFIKVANSKAQMANGKKRKSPNGFVKEPSWVHLDIAPRMTTIDGEYLAKGAAGAPIALLVQFLRTK